MSIDSLAGALGNLEIQQAIIAGNLANRTSGNKQTIGASEVSADFGSLVPKTVTGTDFRKGNIRNTGNPTDLAILNVEQNGKEQVAFFSLNGGEVYSNNSIFRWNNETLVNVDGKPLDGEGGPISRNPSGGEVSFAQDGSVFQDGQVIGKVKAVTFDDLKDLKPVAGGFTLDNAESDALPIAAPRFAPGCVEESNGSNIKHMTDLTKFTKSSETLGTAIRTLHELYANATEYAKST